MKDKFMFSRMFKLGAVLLASMLFAQGALAVTPANAPLTNQATLVYDGNATGITAAVTVRVRLVEAAAVIVADANDASLAENTQFDGTVRVRANTNGPDDYTVSGTIVSPTNHTPSGDDIEYPTATSIVIELGATAVYSTTDGSATIRVPHDNNTGDAFINGLEVGDVVLISGTEYTIATGGIDQTGNTEYTEITFTASVTGGLAAGTGIYEIKDVDVRLDDVGSKTAGGATTFTIRTNVVNGNADSVDSDTLITIVEIAVNKYVRCISAASLCGLVGSPTASLSYDGNDYYADDEVEVAPTGIVEYIIEMENNAGSALTTANLTDTLPTFTTYVVDTLNLNTIRVNDDSVAGDFLLLSGNGGLDVEEDDGTYTRTVDTEGDATIEPAGTAYVTYQVQVSN